MQVVKTGGKLAGIAFAAFFIVIATYLLAALIGAYIPSPDNQESEGHAGKGQTSVGVDPNSDSVEIYLLSTILHVDIAIPVNALKNKEFDFLKADGFPSEHPNLRYILIGWGSKEFYTSTKTLRDIGFRPLITAVSGDKSVMHFIPARDISQNLEAKRISISRAGFEAMLVGMLQTLEHSTSGAPIVLPGENHGVGDLFYEAKGGFDIFHPCNVWAARMLRSAGVKTGVWTPTTYSLLWSLD